jgi:hypothetical protein
VVTKKDFAAVAAILRRHAEDGHSMGNLVDEFSELFAAGNKWFNPETFAIACVPLTRKGE